VKKEEEEEEGSNEEMIRRKKPHKGAEGMRIVGGPVV